MNRYQDLLDRMDGFEAGSLVIDGSDTLKLQGETDDSIIEIPRDYCIEVLNGNHFEKHNHETLLTVKDDIGWPAYAGLYTKIKRKVE
ncbi:hypothetical protein SAMN05421839_10225 [Halolactibacillus halophilus]|uniref:Uncharacterized protein n=1 Tax=Halolactibacillus halophilus TaxID=306540 RepID=A0A1I5LDY9_9BACI|nr:hypothetical protein [Halolactibacillus halophilus]GEM00867.1 hypothetical protein HHA03_03990 [Halolactibacillus halophilus]SFO95510.1 hypothetical protein SAMN05421839_10225 [Halolactibacillus halophilus]